MLALSVVCMTLGAQRDAQQQRAMSRLSYMYVHADGFRSLVAMMAH